MLSHAVRPLNSRLLYQQHQDELDTYSAMLEQAARLQAGDGATIINKDLVKLRSNAAAGFIYWLSKLGHVARTTDHQALVSLKNEYLNIHYPPDENQDGRTEISSTRRTLDK